MFVLYLPDSSYCNFRIATLVYSVYTEFIYICLSWKMNPFSVVLPFFSLLKVFFRGIILYLNQASKI